MKKTIFTLLLALCCFACSSEDKTIDPTVLPESTTTGQNTFGCLIDGWVYAGGRYYPANIFESRTGDSVEFTYSDKDKKVFARIQVGKDEVFSFTIEPPIVQGQKTTFTEAVLKNWGHETKPVEGEVTITRFDLDEMIICGTFQGGRITNGRFDALLSGW